MDSEREGQTWRIVGAGAGVVAGFLVRKALEAAWRRARGTDPPSNPAAGETTWGEALVWAAASGVALAVTRLVAQRGAAEAWRAFTGGYPAELETVSP
jgi:NADPH:quinone reductase-like Zn-dependent oxidoreductase